MKTILAQYHISSEIKISKKVKDHFKSIDFKPTESINVMRIGEDIILTNGEVEKHTDNTVNGKDTIMLIINADGNCIFQHHQSKITLRSGDIIRFDGNKEHSLYFLRNKDSLFSAIIWDVKLSDGIDDLIYDFKVRLKELNKETNH